MKTLIEDALTQEQPIDFDVINALINRAREIGLSPIGGALLMPKKIFDLYSRDDDLAERWEFMSRRAKRRNRRLY